MSERKRINQGWRNALDCNDEMVDYLRHAASLRHLSIRNYVREAINRQLCKEGVDAMLLPEASDRSQPDVACSHGLAVDLHCCDCRRSGFFRPETCACGDLKVN